jgi:hypothetical protein
MPLNNYRSINALAESFVDTFKTELIADRTWTSRSQLGVCPEHCVNGVIDGLRWVGLVKGDRADEQCNDNDGA